MQTKDEGLRKLADKLNPKLKSIETGLFAIALIAVMLKTQDVPYVGLILTLVFGILGMMYFLLGNAPPAQESTRINIFMHRLVNWGSSIVVIGMLFTIQNWPNGRTFIFIGGMPLLITALVSIKMQLSKNLARILVLLIFGAALYFTPAEKLAEFHIIHSLNAH